MEHHRVDDVSRHRALPSSARILRHEALPALVAALTARAQSAVHGHPLERFHELHRPRAVLQKALMAALQEETERVRAVALDVAAFLGLRGDLAVQEQPYARAVQPEDKKGCQPFHVDAYVGHPTTQLGLWVPLLPIAGPEGLWLVEDDVMARALACGPLSAQQDDLRAHARPTPMDVGELLVLGAHTGHGGVPHALPRTRVSFDLRVCPGADAPQGRLGWRSVRVRCGSTDEVRGEVGASRA